MQLDADPEVPDLAFDSRPWSKMRLYEQIAVDQISRRRRNSNREWLGWIPLWIDPRNPEEWKLGALSILQIGGPREVAIHPRDLYSAIFKLKADCYFLVHNHPSGSAIPSRADILLTGKARTLSNELGVPLLGHLIVTRTTNHWIEMKGTDMGPAR
jgi:hypothetical protein